MDRNDAIEQLNRLVEEGETVLATTHSLDYVLGGPWVDSEVYAPWQAKAAMLLHEILPEYQQKRVQQLEEDDSNLTFIAEGWQAQLQGALDAIEQGVIDLAEDKEESCDIVIERMLERFPDFVSSINRRHAKDVAVYGGRQIKELLLKREDLRASAMANTEEDFAIAFYDLGEDVLYEGLKQNNQFFGEVLKDENLMRRLLDLYVHEVYRTLRGEQ